MQCLRPNKNSQVCHYIEYQLAKMGKFAMEAIEYQRAAAIRIYKPMSLIPATT